MTRNVHEEARALFDRHIKPVLTEIRDSQSEEDAEYFAGSIVYHLRGELGWSVAYYCKADALHYWCMETDRDEDELTDEQRRRIRGLLEHVASQQGVERRAVARRVHRQLHRRAH
jgi:hypothetical protein